VIIDLEGFNSDHLTTIGLKVYAALLKELQDLFPDMLRQVCFSGTPQFSPGPYNF